MRFIELREEVQQDITVKYVYATAVFTTKNFVLTTPCWRKLEVKEDSLTYRGGKNISNVEMLET